MPDNNKLSLKNGYDLPEKVGIIFSDVKREYFPTEEQYITEKDAKKDAQVIASYLRKLGIRIFLYPGNSVLTEKLKMDKPNLVINLADSVKGYESLAAAIPGVMELLDIAYTGADMLGMSLDTNKFVIKKLLQQNGVPVPNYQLFTSSGELMDPTLRFPLISKLNEIHGSVEIGKDAVSENEKALRERIKYLITTYKQPVLVEEFIVGREITGILLEGLNKKVYLAEKIFHFVKDEERKYHFLTFEEQWLDKGKSAFHYQKYNDNLLAEYVRKAFDVARMMDYGKFDVRIDSSGRYFFIDSNTNPAFGPKELDCAMASILDLYGIRFIEILKRLLLNTVRDYQGKERLPLAS
jgi:D-alanine-D-alanine ligase